jgi:hypothetical protein
MAFVVGPRISHDGPITSCICIYIYTYVCQRGRYGNVVNYNILQLIHLHPFTNVRQRVMYNGGLGSVGKIQILGGRWVVTMDIYTKKPSLAIKLMATTRLVILNCGSTPPPELDGFSWALKKTAIMQHSVAQHLSILYAYCHTYRIGFTKDFGWI